MHKLRVKVSRRWRGVAWRGTRRLPVSRKVEEGKARASKSVEKTMSRVLDAGVVILKERATKGPRGIYLFPPSASKTVR